jgi:hypothetical protein
MLLQSLLVVCLVSACFVYAASQLMPLAVLQALARTLLRWPLPVFLEHAFEKIAQAKGGCGSGCDGCDRSPSRAALPGAAQKTVERVLVFHPALRRTPTAQSLNPDHP